MPREKTQAFFEDKYRVNNDPWSYNNRAVEILRYEYIARLVKGIKTGYERVLDTGCSKAHLSLLLKDHAKEIYAVDISETAVKNAEKHYSKIINAADAKYFFMKEDISSLTFPDNYFDLVLLCDGINEWFNREENRKKALDEAFRVLRKGGCAVLSDYQNPDNFDDYISFIKNSRFKILNTNYLYDRLSYRFNSWIKAFENYSFAQWLFNNKPLANTLFKISALFGKNGAKHIVVIAVKE